MCVHYIGETSTSVVQQSVADDFELDDIQMVIISNL